MMSLTKEATSNAGEAWTDDSSGTGSSNGNLSNENGATTSASGATKPTLTLYTALYQYYDRVLHVCNDYLSIRDDDTIVKHDFEHLASMQVGYITAKLMLKCSLLIRYITRLGLFWKFVFRYDHHVFLDMLILMNRYREIFIMFADKEKQYEFYGQRQDQQMGDQPLFKLTPRLNKTCLVTRPEDHIFFAPPDDENVASRFDSFNATDPDTFPFVKASELQLRDATFFDPNNPAGQPLLPHKKFSETSEQLVFAKPRFDAYGNQCDIMDLENIRSTFRPARVNFFLFEKVLGNHKALRDVLGDDHALVTVRVWSKRFLPGQQALNAVLLVSDQGPISNSQINTAYLIPNEKSGVVEMTYEEAEQHRTGSEKSFWTQTLDKIRNFFSMKRNSGGLAVQDCALTIPFHDQIIQASQWLHDQTPQVPFLAYDFAICDDGLYLLESNVMCSYSKYADVVGNFYHWSEADWYVQNVVSNYVENENEGHGDGEQ